MGRVLLPFGEDCTASQMGRREARHRGNRSLAERVNERAQSAKGGDQSG